MWFFKTGKEDKFWDIDIRSKLIKCDVGLQAQFTD